MSRDRNFKASQRCLIQPLESRRLLSTVFVDVNAPGSVQDGTSWDTAYTDLQAALAATPADSGDQIHVAQGTYIPATGTSFQLKNGVSLLGGYAGFGAANPDARDVIGTPTVLNHVRGGGTNSTTVFDGFKVVSLGFGDIGLENDAGSPTISDCTFTGGGGIDNINNSSPQITNCLFTHGEGEFPGAIGNTNSSALISNCRFEYYHAVYGGAIDNERSSVTVRNCTFTNNQSTHEGQAVYNYRSTVTFIDCDFSNNGGPSDSESGTIYNRDTVLTLTRCTFTSNINMQAGGVISNSSTLPIVATDCTFTRNKSEYAGGAIYGSGPLSLTNCVFQGNVASYYGGAIDITGDLTLVNCVFAGNMNFEYGGGAIDMSQGTATITNCTFSGNTASGTGGAINLTNSVLSLNNSILAGDSAGIDGNEIFVVPSGTSSLTFNHSIVTVDRSTNLPPRFIRAPSAGPDGVWGTPDDNYGNLRLQSGASSGSISPAIDAGDNAAVPAGITTDVEGNQRFIDIPGVHDPGAIVDIGAYERQLPLAVTIALFTADGAGPSLKFTLNNVLSVPSLSAGDVIVKQVLADGSLGGNVSVQSYRYDPATKTVTFVLPPSTPDGNYRAILVSGTVTDTYGSTLAGNYSFDFFILAGDANHDRHVNLLDLQIMATNWCKSGMQFCQGDCNYDGKVDSADLSILASHWQKMLVAPCRQSRRQSDQPHEERPSGL